MHTTEATTANDWDGALKGDKAAFRRWVEGHLDGLLEAARKEIGYRRALGDLQNATVAPAELVGDTLLDAWRQRHRRPVGLDPRIWLLGIQQRVLERAVRRAASVELVELRSLDEPLEAPARATDTDDEFWEWPAPPEALLWEDVVADAESASGSALGADDRRRLVTLARRASLLHHELGVPVTEVARSLHVSARAAHALLEWARELDSEEEDES